MKKRLLILLLLPVIAIGQVTSDSLWNAWSNESLENSIRLSALLELSKNVNTISPDSSFYLAGVAYKFAEEQQLQTVMAQALLNQGIALDMRGNGALAVEYYNKASVIYTKTGNKSGRAKTIANIGIIYLANNEFEKALTHFSEALAIMDTLGLNQLRSTVLNRMGEVYHKLNQHSRAIELYEKAILNDKNNLNSSEENIAISYSGIASVLIDQKKYNTAKEKLTLSLALLKKHLH